MDEELVQKHHCDDLTEFMMLLLSKEIISSSHNFDNPQFNALLSNCIRFIA